MKATEVRLGNLIKERNDFKEVTFSDLNGLLSGKHTFDPILLTEQWLNNSELQQLFSPNIWHTDLFGIFYQKNQERYSKLRKGCFYLVVQDSEKNLVITNFELKYVHQLQNIYFSLIGEELKFNMEKLIINPLKNLSVDELNDFRTAIHRNFQVIKVKGEIVEDLHTKWADLYHNCYKYAHNHEKIITKGYPKSLDRTYGDIIMIMIIEELKIKC